MGVNMCGCVMCHLSPPDCVTCSHLSWLRLISPCHLRGPVTYGRCVSVGVCLTACVAVGVLEYSPCSCRHWTRDDRGPQVM